MAYSGDVCTVNLGLFKSDETCALILQSFEVKTNDLKITKIFEKCIFNNTYLRGERELFVGYHFVTKSYKIKNCFIRPDWLLKISNMIVWKSKP